MRLKLAVPGFVLLLLAGACGGTPAAGPAAAPVTWTEPAKYGFVLTSECGERALIGRFRVTVEQGRVSATEGLDDAARRALMLRMADLVPTLAKLEAEAETARKAGAEVVEVVRDPADGHPTKVTIDPRKNAIDDEACYTIEEYTIGSAGAPSPSPSR